LIARSGAVHADGFPADVIFHLQHAHGPQYGRVLEVARRDARLAERIVVDLPYIWAEVPYAIEQEMALSISDILSRRTHILNESVDNGMEAAPQVAAMLGEYMDWDRARMEKELRDFEEQVALARAYR
jgi:glycerol-3-phosphate dehydrogenase